MDLTSSCLMFHLLQRTVRSGLHYKMKILELYGKFQKISGRSYSYETSPNAIDKQNKFQSRDLVLFQLNPDQPKSTKLTTIYFYYFVVGFSFL